MTANKAVELRSLRLCLQRLYPKDAGSVVPYRSLPAVAQFQDWDSFGPHDAARLIAGQAGVRPDTPGTWLQLALVLLESGEVVGDCGGRRGPAIPVAAGPAVRNRLLASKISSRAPFYTGARIALLRRPASASHP